MDFFTPEIITGLTSLAGGAFTGMIANQQKMLLASMQHTMDVASKGNENSNDASNRSKASSSFLQPVVGITIIAVAFVGLLLVALNPDIPVSYLHEVRKGKFLGLFGGGESVEVLEANGLVLPPYVKYSVISVVNFLFGASVMKLRRV